MHYLSLLPSLITAVTLSVIDLRTRMVPRVIVACGFVGQAIVFALIGGPGELAHLATAIGFALASGLLQAALCVLKPGAMGLGDATALAFFSLGIAWHFGAVGICTLWLVTGVLGICALGIAQASSRVTSRRAIKGAVAGVVRREARHISIAFVPVLSAAALVTYLALEML